MHVLMMWGCCNVLGMIIRKKNIKNNKKISPSSTYTGQGPQVSINVCITCRGQNTALNHGLLLDMHMYACVCTCETFGSVS